MIDNTPIYIPLENVVGEKTGKPYTGQFRVKKYLTHDERTEVTRYVEHKCRGIERDQNLLLLLSTLGHLKFHIVEAPAWWEADGFNLIDEKPVWELASQLLDHQKPPESKANTESQQSS